MISPYRYPTWHDMNIESWNDEQVRAEARGFPISLSSGYFEAAPTPRDFALSHLTDYTGTVKLTGKPPSLLSAAQMSAKSRKIASATPRPDSCSPGHFFKKRTG